jgi:hypothetical protein
MHKESHPLAGKTVHLKDDIFALGGVEPGAEYRLEDWWDVVTGGSWMDAEGNPAALKYAMRSGFSHSIPLDNEVVYGKIGPFGHLIHVSEIAE